MAVTPLPIYTVPFQGFVNVGAQSDNPVADMEFVNDGYTMLFVFNGDSMEDLTVTITGVPDDAGRSKTIEETVSSGGGTYIFGPYRPIWWNSGGSTSVSFAISGDDFSSVSVLAFNVQV